MFKQQIRFCTGHNGTRIAYATSGWRPPLIKGADIGLVRGDILGLHAWSAAGVGLITARKA
ncbi:MAG: hypothetical protein ABJA83_03020 [Burkholderiaceae bacterium]